ncbi:glycoside hydrolase family 3 N-terminal domain-containing protein [Acuticoccus kandeliae]|uniref:glycoside hydrolase family 3 N-terminal domain-containing protein n=1 Tax=Acuticoccus kandeliae TaxID=2073160 RepID=UPI00147379FB|nr:glycoside hydrolase family 3 N-terminal domain-containing protein [Acuticoccus kandeliae]
MIAALVAEMNLAEKIGQLTMTSAGMAITGPVPGHAWLEEIEAGTVGNLLNLWGKAKTDEAQRVAVEKSRLKIPLLLGFDVIHGHRTLVPIPPGEAAAFDPDLWARTARDAAREATADGISMTFAPMLDIARDPRWGRMAESFGEDPLLGARFAQAKVAGFQGAALADAAALAACAKHYVGYGAVTAGREYASVDLSDRTLLEVHMPPFAAAVEAGVASLMPGFHDLAGVPMTAHGSLLRAHLRGRLGFEGVIVSDYNAIRELIAHGVAADIEEAAALALNAGVDIDMMGFAYIEGLPGALARGLVEMGDVDAAVTRVLTLKAALGLFADPFARGATPLPESERAAIRATAREAATRSIVLLQNDGVLPFSPDVRRVALIGPLADDARAMHGAWAAAADAGEAVSYAKGLAAGSGLEVRTIPGVSVEGMDESGIAEAVRLAEWADIVVLALGEAPEMSGEGGSRMHPGLPGAQEALFAAIAATGRKIVTILNAGRPLVVPRVLAHSNAVLMAFAAGTQSGAAMADLLTGRESPSGRLPITWPAAVGQIPIISTERPTGRPEEAENRYTTRYLDGPNAPAFPFGHGLGYTRFTIGEPVADRTVLRPGERVSVRVPVTNEGARAGRLTLFLFSRDPVARLARPLLELRDFASLALEPGASGTLTLSLAADDLAYLDEALEPLLEDGDIVLLVGTEADRARLAAITIRLETGAPVA